MFAKKQPRETNKIFKNFLDNFRKNKKFKNSPREIGEVKRGKKRVTFKIDTEDE